MKNQFKFLGLIAFAAAALCLSGCSKNDSAQEKTTAIKKDYDICIYNTDTTIGSALRKMCDEYTEKTGLIIRTITPTDDDNTIEHLESYIDSEYFPDIFTVSSINELEKWKAKNAVWDFGNATEDSFKTITNNIPEYLKLSSNTADSFGIPYTIEGFGFIADPKMIASLFGSDKYSAAINDLKECSFDEFRSFTEAVRAYVNGSGIYTFTLNGKNYSFKPEKTSLSKNLNSTFSVAANTPKNISMYLANSALASVFKTAAVANTANNEAISSLSSPLVKFAETLDLITLNLAGSTGSMGRGTEITSSSQNNSTAAMKNFINGKSVFLLASTQDYNSLATFNSLIAKRCVFIPIKMPIDESEITSSPEIAKNLNRGLAVYAPKYYCINAKSSDKVKKYAQDFLTWTQTSDLAKKYIISEFGFTPYNTSDSSLIDNPLSRSMLEYVSENRVLPTVYPGAPSTWCTEVFGKYLMEQYLTKISWIYQDYEAIAKYGIDKWKELKGD